MLSIKKGNFHKIHPLFSLSIATILVGTVSLTIANDEEFTLPLSKEVPVVKKDIVPISKAIDAVTEQQPVVEEVVSEQPTVVEEVVSESAVQETIESILDKEIIEILKSPEIVESYRVKPEMDFSVSDKRKLGGFNIIETGPELTIDQIKQFQAIIFDVSQYSLDEIKKCPFRPELGFVFKKGEERVEFLSSVGCDKYMIILNKAQNQGDYRSSARQPLLELRNSLFLKENKGVRG